MDKDKAEVEKTYWLDDKKNVKKILLALYVTCGGLFLADFFYHKHTELDVEEWFGFHAMYGFIACVLLVLIAKQMRKILARPEKYYDSVEADERGEARKE